MSAQKGSKTNKKDVVQRIKGKALSYDKIGGCSQCVLLAIQEEFGIGDLESFKAATVLSGGLHQGGTCGALLGALMSLGLVFGREKIEDLNKFRQANQVAHEISDRFKEELKKQFDFDRTLESTLCPDIQKYIFGRSFDFRTEREAFEATGGHDDDKCPKVCSIAAQVAAETILKLKIP